MPASTALIPVFKQARNLTSLKVYPGTQVANTVTWGTPVELAVAASGTGTFRSFSFDPSTSDVSLRPADSLIENMATEFETWTATITEIASLGSIGVFLLSSAYTYFRIIAKYKANGADAATELAIVVIGKRSNSPTGINAGENNDSMTLVPCGIPAYAGLSSAIPGTY